MKFSSEILALLLVLPYGHDMGEIHPKHLKLEGECKTMKAHETVFPPSTPEVSFRTAPASRVQVDPSLAPVHSFTLHEE